MAVKPITLEDLMKMDGRALHAIMMRGRDIDPEAVAGKQFLGVDLSMPPLMHRVLWQTFRKTFYRDPQTGVVRGWNVKLEQYGVDGPRVAKRNRDGSEVTFGHYHLREAVGHVFPNGWRGGKFLDYGVAGNVPLDLARFGFCPLVAVNAGDNDLLLGWEIFKVGEGFLKLPLYWALKADGPIEHVVAPPRG